MAERRGPLGGSRPLLALGRSGFDLLHFPMHETTPVFAAVRQPVVMTIHSVEPLFLAAEDLLGRPAPHLWRLPYRMLRLVRSRVRLVVVPSRRTAAEIEEHLRIPADRIKVIPHGVDHAVFRPVDAAAGLVRAAFGLERAYVLHASHHQPQKNVVRLIRAFAELDGSDLELVLAGELGRCEEDYVEASRASGIEQRLRLIGPVRDDSLLAALYAGARAVAYPSLHESFGLPALEAMACGCPVVASRDTGVAETVGDAGRLVDPRDTAAIAAALAETALDEGAHSEFARRGLERARGFTWERSATAHVEAYAEAVA
jgi:glycosyltransferase involved in cell wall biosynthesis